MWYKTITGGMREPLKAYIEANLETLNDAPFLMGRNCQVHEDARLKDWAVLGNDISLEKGAEVTRSILWGNVTVKENVRVIDSVVTRTGEVTKDLVGVIG